MKSCVGSTWCRYGVQDSVGLAIALELRYRGLRSPHKLKLGRLRAARASAPRRAARTSGSSRPTTAGTSTSAATAASRPGTPSCSPRTSTPRRWCARSTGSSCTTSAPPTGCSAPRRGWTTTRAASTAIRAVVLDDSLGIGADLDAAMAGHVDVLRGRVGRGPRRPGEAAPVRVVRQRARRARRPARLRERAWPGPPRHRGRASRRGAVAHRRHDPGGAPMTVDDAPVADGAADAGPRRSAALEDLSARARRRRAGRRQPGRALPHVDDTVHAVQQRDPYSGANVMSPRHRRHPRRRRRPSPHRCTSRSSTCGPGSASTRSARSRAHLTATVARSWSRDGVVLRRRTDGRERG